MAQPVGSTQALEKAYTPIHHTFKDTAPQIPQGYDVYMVIIHSNEGRAYSMITTEPERLQFMRDSRSVSTPTRRCPSCSQHGTSTRTRQPARSTASCLILPRAGKSMIGDSDAERDEKTEGRLLAYFRAHGHKVQDLTPMMKRGG